jgi:hypothetical protein
MHIDLKEISMYVSTNVIIIGEVRKKKKNYFTIRKEEKLRIRK